MFHSAPGADFVWNEIFLSVSAVRDRSSPGGGFLSEKIVYGPRPFGSGTRAFVLNQVLVYRSGTVWLWGPFLCLGRIFVGSPPGVGFLFFGTKYYCVCGRRLFGSGSRFWSYTVRSRLDLKEKQGVDVVTAALTSVRNALQKPETVFNLRRLVLTSRPWFEHQGHLPTKRRTITQPFWMN